MAWNVDDAWPEPTKLTLRRRVKEIQRASKSKSPEELASIRKRKIERLREQLAKLEAQTGDLK